MPIDKEELLKKLIEELSQPIDKSKPWMTARLLSSRINFEYSVTEIEECLLDYYKKAYNAKKVPVIRYSSLPSRASLEVLWGHINFVGQRPLHDIRRENVADPLLGLEVDQDGEADVFISHSFKDYADVIQIGKILQKEEIRPWLAETHIQQDEHIHEAVISALEDTKCFAVYLSENSLSSKWTGKEYNYASTRNKKIIVIADCRSPMVLKFMERGLQRAPQVEEIVSGDAAYFFKDLFSDRENITYFVIYPEDYSIELDHSQSTNILPFNQMASLIRNINTTPS